MGLIFFRYFIFWYGSGLIKLLKYFKAFMLILADNFSVKNSITTFFAPWKRDVLTLQGLPLDQKVKAIIFNIVSRIFGAFVKTVTLIIFISAFIVLFAFELCIFAIWIIAPALPIISVILFLISL